MVRLVATGGDVRELQRTLWLLVPGAAVDATFLRGLWVFNREAPRIAEEL